MNKRERLDKRRYNIRLSQIITTYGPGAIIDFVDQPLMTATPKEWKKFHTIHDERLEKVLGVDGFRFHKSSDADTGVPFVRFPRWYFCPKCKRFQSLSAWEKEYVPPKNGTEFMIQPKCSECKVQLVSPSVLVACKNGHIDDFPWIAWIHLKKGGICNNPELEIVSNSGSLGLESFKVKCKCGASNTLEGAFRKDAFEKAKVNEEFKEKFKCKSKLQWKGEKDERDDIYPQAVLRNASNIYFSKIESSIVIPPYSDEINSLIEDSDEFKALISTKNKKEKKGQLEEFIREDLEEYVSEIAKELRKEDSIYVIDKIIRRKLDNNLVDFKSSRNTYRFEEYNALLGNIQEESFNSRDFKVENIGGSEYKINEISSVTLVKKLREVRALVGFTRLEPPEHYIMGNESSGGTAKLIDIKDKEDRWYPAYEVRGEGIFIELNANLIEQWIENNPYIIERSLILENRYNEDKKEENKRPVTPKFILLHTLSHILIRELSFECGYSATSLRERIYCNSPEESDLMSGILIYTADSDSEGSLGGLVKQGDPNILPKIFINALRRARWCSYDPVCINSGGQGRKSLNFSACHSCVLLPETSCEEFNVLLDRVSLVGILENKEIGFFKSYI